MQQSGREAAFLFSFKQLAMFFLLNSFDHLA